MTWRRPSPRARWAVAAWARRHALGAPLVLALLAIAGLVLGTGNERFPAFSDDEGTYVAQAWAVLSEGSLAHYTYWYDHPPLGWLQLAGASWLAGPLLGGDHAMADARAVMIAPALISCLLLYVLGRRLGLARPFAAAAVLLFALSPLAVSMLRMVYLDNIATPWVLGAFVLAATPERRLWAYAGAGACFAVAVLTKETTLVLLPALALQVLATLDRRTRTFCLTAFVSALVLVGIGYPLFAVLKGELLPGPGHVSLVDAIEFQLHGRPSTGSALEAGSQSRDLVEDWLAVDPWLLGVGVVLAPIGLAVRRLRPAALALALLVLVGLRPGYLPQPYVIGLLPFCALIAAGLANALARRPAPTWARGAAATAALAVLALALPLWHGADRDALRADQAGASYAATDWVERNIDRRARLLVDDTYYVDLVEAGFARRFGVVWFYKLDFTTNLDPSIARALPGGWRSFDYVISTPVMRSALARTPEGLESVRGALRHSSPVARFGAGPQRVEVRRLRGPGTGSGRLPASSPATAVQ